MSRQDLSEREQVWQQLIVKCNCASYIWDPVEEGQAGMSKQREQLSRAVYLCCTRVPLSVHTDGLFELAHGRGR